MNWLQRKISLFQRNGLWKMKLWWLSVFPRAWQIASSSRLFFLWYFSWSMLHFSGNLGDDHSFGWILACTAPWTFSSATCPLWTSIPLCHWSQDGNWHLCGEKSHLFLWLCCPDLVFIFLIYFYFIFYFIIYFV